MVSPSSRMQSNLPGANSLLPKGTLERPGAILIDLDDTIITDDSVNQRSWDLVTKKYAPIIGTVSPAELLSIIQATTKVFWADPENHRRGRLQLFQTRRELVARALNQAGLADKKLGYEIADEYTAQKTASIAPIPGAIETLRQLKNLNIPLALITNGGSDVQRAKIERFGLETYFTYILVEGEFGFGKPEKQVFQACLEKLVVKPSTVWMVGDDLQRDIGGAMRLGIQGIWIDWRQKGLPLNSTIKPDCVIRTFSELRDSLEINP